MSHRVDSFSVPPAFDVGFDVSPYWSLACQGTYYASAKIGIPFVIMECVYLNKKQGLARALPVDGTPRYYEKRSETLSVRYEQAFAECLDHQTQAKSPGQDPYFLIHGSVHDYAMGYGR